MREKIFSLFTNPSDMTWEQILMNIGVAALLGFFVFISYYISHRGTIYSKKFNASLVILTVLTGTVMTVIGNNIALSLGMVGALSIVRFRTAIKDPMDLLYLFWAITTGIASGAGMYGLAFIALLVMIVLVWGFYHKQRLGEVYVAVIRYEGDDTGDEILREFGKMKYFVKSKTLRGQTAELAVEVFCRRDNLFFAEKIRNIENVKDVTLIQYNGEYHG